MVENRLPARSRHQPVEVLYGHDRELSAWIGEGLGEEFELHDSAIGFVKKGKIIGGVVYHNYRGTGIEASIYTTERWANKHTLFHIFAYPFITLECLRFSAVTRSRNQSARTFLEKLGFEQEGDIRSAFRDDDGILYGMLKNECRWVNYG